MVSFRKASLLALAAASTVEARPAINADNDDLAGTPRVETYYRTLTGYRTIYETKTKSKGMPKPTGYAETMSFGWKGHTYTVVAPKHSKAPHVDPKPKPGGPIRSYQTTWQDVTATVVMGQGEASKPPLPVRTEWPEGYPNESENPSPNVAPSTTPAPPVSTTPSATSKEEGPTSTPAVSSSTPSGAGSPESCAALAPGGKSTKYSDPDGVEYTVSCKHDIVGGDLEAKAADAFKDCFHICNTTPKCAGFSWLVGDGPGTCYLKSSQGGTLSPSSADVAQRSSPVPAASGSESSSGSTATSASDSQPSSTGSCPSVGDKFDDYTIACGKDYAGNDIDVRGAPSFADCAPQCDGIPGCVGWSYLGGSGAGSCYFKGSIGGGSDNSGVDSGYRSTPKIPAASTTSKSSSPTSQSASSTNDCSSIASQSTIYEGYTIQCKTDHNGGDSVNVPGSSFRDCFGKCNDKEGCIGFAFTGGKDYGVCYLKSSLTGASSNQGVDFAYKGGENTASTTSASSTAVTTPSTTAQPSADSPTTTVSTSAASPTTTAAPTSISKPEPNPTCRKPGAKDKKGRQYCDPAVPLPHKYTCQQWEDGCYYVTKNPGKGHHGICPPVGHFDKQGRYSCNPAHHYEHIGQTCQAEKNGCYYLIPYMKPDGPKPNGPKPDGPKPDGPKPHGPTEKPTPTTTNEPTSAATDKQPSPTLGQPTTTTGTNSPVPAPSEEAECQLIKDSRKFRLKTIVEQGNSELDGVWLAKVPVPGLASWKSALTKAAEDAADLFMHPRNTGIFSWHGGCSFSGLGLSTPDWAVGGWFGWGRRQKSSVGDCTFSKDGGSSGFKMENGGLLGSSAPNFHKWVACKDDQGKMELKYTVQSVFDPLSWFGPDLNRCAYVKMQAQYD